MIIKPFLEEEQIVNQEVRLFIAEVNYQYLQWRNKVQTEYKQSFDRDKIRNVPGLLYEKMILTVKNFSWPECRIELMEQVCFNNSNHQSELWKMISRTVLRSVDKNKKKKNYRITEAFDEVELDERSTLPILITFLICEGKVLQQQWNQQIDKRVQSGKITEIEADFLKKKGTSILYLLILESDAGYMMEKNEEKIYAELWHEAISLYNWDTIQCKNIQRVLWEILWEVLKRLFGDSISVPQRKALLMSQERHEIEAENLGNQL